MKSRIKTRRLLTSRHSIMYNLSMNEPSPVSKILTLSKIKHSEFVHPGTIHSIEQAANERNQSVDQIIRSILFRLAEDQYAIVLIAGPKQVDWKKLRQHFKKSRLSMASQEEVLEITGYQIGAVSPFGIPKNIPILVDNSVLSQQSISIGSGRRGTTIILDTKSLIVALSNIETGNFIKA